MDGSLPIGQIDVFTIPRHDKRFLLAAGIRVHRRSSRAFVAFLSSSGFGGWPTF